MNVLQRTMLLAWSIFTCASATAQDRPLEVFDAHAAGPLPARFVLPVPNGGEHSVLLIRRFRSDIRVNGEPAAMFRAEIDGRPGSIVRQGGILDITLDEEVPAAPAGTGPIDYELSPGETLPAVPLVRSLGRKAPGADPDTGITVWLFLHRDAQEYDRAKVLSWYANWWLDDMETTVTPDVPVRIWVVESAHGITDMDYHAGTIHQRMGDLSVRGREFAAASGETTTPLHKYVLLVGKPAGNWPKGAIGVAIQAHGAAMISNEGPRLVLAHELGHLLGARHENAESRFLCDTNMIEKAEYLKPPCKVYTKANDALIRQYVHDRRGR